MPRKGTGEYPPGWDDFSRRLKDEGGWRCQRCGHPHDHAGGYTLTVHHLDMNPANNSWYNTVALCQRCHLSVQARVDLDRPWVLTDHSDWAKPAIAGYYAHKYLGLDLTRAEVDASLDLLLDVEREIVISSVEPCDLADIARQRLAKAAL